jgi:predicted nucleic acid-binding protein
MPTGDELLVDTSAAVALVVDGHEGHDAAHAFIGRRRIGLAGHAAFETFSVLTRLPAPHRRSARAVAALLDATFPATRFLSPDRSAALVRSFGASGIAGGSVYDALVAAVAEEHGLALITRDRRALPVYGAFDVRVDVIN